MLVVTIVCVVVVVLVLANTILVALLGLTCPQCGYIVEECKKGRLRQRYKCANCGSYFWDRTLEEVEMFSCKTCHWYKNDALPDIEKTCKCPRMVYGYGSRDRDDDGVLIEDDEGWGMIPGPDFGCIHHKDKE